MPSLIQLEAVVQLACYYRVIENSMCLVWRYRFHLSHSWTGWSSCEFTCSRYHLGKHRLSVTLQCEAFVGFPHAGPACVPVCALRVDVYFFDKVLITEGLTKLNIYFCWLLAPVSAARTSRATHIHPHTRIHTCGGTFCVEHRRRRAAEIVVVYFGG